MFSGVEKQELGSNYLDGGIPFVYDAASVLVLLPGKSAL